MISRQIKTIDYIKIGFDKNFIRSLTLLSKRKIEPITINVDDKDIIIGIKCPVVMNEDTFEEDKKIIESDILKAFADILSSEICNREQEETIFPQVNQRLIKYNPFPCPRCGSTNTIGYGRRKTGTGLKAIRYCRNCNKCYTNQENTIWKMKNRRDVIEEALKLSENNTLRETARLIKEKFDVDISHSAIFHWRKNKKLQESLQESITNAPTKVDLNR